MEEEVHERPLDREFAGLVGSRRIADVTTILRFQHLLDKHELAPKILLTINAGQAAQGLMLKTGTPVDAALMAASSLTPNNSGTGDQEMHQAEKSNQWRFGMKAHIGVDAESGLVHTVISTATDVSDVTQAAGLLQGDETDVFDDTGSRGIANRKEPKDLEAT